MSHHAVHVIIMKTFALQSYKHVGSVFSVGP